MFFNAQQSHYIIGALKKYREINGHDPERIIVYRDGVGDGQVLNFHILL